MLSGYKCPSSIKRIGKLFTTMQKKRRELEEKLEALLTEIIAFYFDSESYCGV
jgi:hypothetical protein